MLVILLIATALTDMLYSCDPHLDVKVAQVKKLVQGKGSFYKRDMADMTLDLTADFRQCFHWNLKQVFLYVEAEYSAPGRAVNQVALYDKIITDQSKALVKRPQLDQKYPFADYGSALRNATLDIVISYNLMPKTGKLRLYHKRFPNAVTLPGEYVGLNKPFARYYKIDKS